MVLSKQTIERWAKNGNQYNHLKQERTAWQLFDRETLTKTEEYLSLIRGLSRFNRDTIVRDFVIISSFKREGAFVEFGSVTTSNFPIVIEEITGEDPERGIFRKPILEAKDRLSLRTKETKEINI